MLRKHRVSLSTAQAHFILSWVSQMEDPLAREVEQIIHMELIKERGNISAKLGFNSPPPTPNGVGFMFNPEQLEVTGKKIGAELHGYFQQLEKMEAFRRAQIPSQEGEYVQSIEQKNKEDAERKKERELLEKEGFFSNKEQALK